MQSEQEGSPLPSAKVLLKYLHLLRMQYCDARNKLKLSAVPLEDETELGKQRLLGLPQPPPSRGPLAFTPSTDACVHGDVWVTNGCLDRPSPQDLDSLGLGTTYVHALTMLARKDPFVALTG